MLSQSLSTILYVQPYNWQCGPHESLHALVTNLDRRRFLPLVVLPNRSPISDEFANLGVEVHFDPGIRTIPRSFSPVRQIRFWASTLTCLRRLTDLIRLKSVRLVHINSEACWVGGITARLAKVPAFTHLHGLTILSPPWVGWLTAKFLNGFNQGLIATSTRVKREFVARGAREDLIQVIYNGVEVQAFNPTRVFPTLRSELKIPNGQPLVGMIANFDPRKGHHHFVSGCALVHKRMPNAQFVIVGDTQLDRGYSQRIQQLSLRHGLAKVLHILGPRKDIPNILMSLDVVVQPSLTEAGPLVPIEAMAMERAIVVTDVGGNSEEVVNEQTGLVVPVGDVQSLSDAILKLLSDPPLARRLGGLGRQRVLDMFTEEVYVWKVQQLYEKLLGTKEIETTLS